MSLAAATRAGFIDGSARFDRSALAGPASTSVVGVSRHVGLIPADKGMPYIKNRTPQADYLPAFERKSRSWFSGQQCLHRRGNSGFRVVGVKKRHAQIEQDIVCGE